jgi:hypothetical protein
VEYRNKAEWQAAVGDFATLDFTGLQNGEVLFDQYSDLGVLFPDGNDTVRNVPSIFIEDGWGLRDNFTGTITIEFDTPRTAIASDHPGFATFFLYWEGKPVGRADFLNGGAGNFSGILSSIPFDAVEIVDVTGGSVAIDDLHFSIPTPSALTCIGGGLAMVLSRRRRI